MVLLILLAPLTWWVLTDRTDAPAEEQGRPGAPRILALGDSYMSGEGAPSFIEGTNDESSDDPRCRRSVSAYPVRLAEILSADGPERGIDFLACSGAVTEDVDADGVRRDHPNDIVAQLEQAASLPHLADVDLVLVSIGGNDARFGEIGQGCLYPGSCSDLRSVWLNRLPDVRDQVADAYRRILRFFDPELPDRPREPPPIVAVPYPRLVNEDGCDWSLLDTPEHAFLSEFVAALNAEIAAAAADTGVHFASDVVHAYGNRRICAAGGPDNAAVNFLALGPTEGGFADRLQPTNWTHNSLHPKPDGHDRVAQVLARIVRSLPSTPIAGDPGASLRVTASSRVFAESFPRGDDGGPPQSCPAVRRDEEGNLIGAVPAVDRFATRVLVLDADTAVRVPAVDPDTEFCYTDPTGRWRRSQPVARRGVIGSIQPGTATEEPGVTVLFQPPGISQAAQRATDPDDRRRRLPQGEHRQYVIYREADSGDWRQLIIDYCDLNDACPSDVGGWKTDQLTAGFRSAALVIVLAGGGGLLLAGWAAMRIREADPLLSAERSEHPDRERSRSEH